MTFRERIMMLFGRQPVKKQISTKVIMIGIVAVIISGGFFMAYRWYSANREQAAQRAFNDCVQKYYGALADAQQWQNVERMCQEGYSQFTSSNLAPYFLVYKAEALMKQHKVKDALAEMDTMLASVLPKASPVYSLYKIKRMLMAIDCDQDQVYVAELGQAGLEKIKKDALAQLDLLAHDTKNIYRDMALYYVGLYHWTHDALDLAKKTWQELSAIKADEQKTASWSEQSTSPWAALVEDKVG
jgi:hypothetical protein